MVECQKWAQALEGDGELGFQSRRRVVMLEEKIGAGDDDFRQELVQTHSSESSMKMPSPSLDVATDINIKVGEYFPI